MRVCLSAPNTLIFPDGGHLWVFLNWALGFRSLGHEVVWLDVVGEKDPPETVARQVRELQSRLEPYGLNRALALCTPAGEPYTHGEGLDLLPLDAAVGCDVLCDLRYNLANRVVSQFRRSMLIDIDPGLFQMSIDMGPFEVAPHSIYFTVGEWTKWQAEIKPMFRTHGCDWHYIPPPVALDAWPVSTTADVGAMTTVSSWYKGDEYMRDEKGEYYDNSKRAAFQDYLDTPRRSPIPLELCLNLFGYRPEIELLESKGWRYRETATVSHPLDYHRYIQQSRGEFSCAKPGYVRMNTGWLSDRTACYLASGKPVVIQKTGKSDLFPDRHGTCRFTTPEEAVAMLQHVHANYADHAQAARQLAEDHLDARKVLTRVLERTLG